MAPSTCGQEKMDLLEFLDGMVRRAPVRQHLHAIAERLDSRLNANPPEPMAWEPVSLDVYGVELPGEILSSWIFVLRAKTASGAERHPNSVQRMMSLRGRGDLQTKERLDDPWSSHALESDPHRPLVNRWLVIPVNVWHQAVVPNQNWAVVSFHTVPAAELIEERPDPSNFERLEQKRYFSKTPSKRDTAT
jgi:hypothetical protein